MRYAEESSSAAARTLRTVISLVIGMAAGGGLYLWQSNLHLAIAAFVIVAHATGVIVHFQRSALLDVQLRRELAQMRINSAPRRTLRMLGDLYFWWSLFFGVATITIACYFAGLQNFTTLGLIALAWSIISLMLGYGVTLLYPTTRCRQCGYQLIGQLDQFDPQQALRCPECGRIWTKAQLCLVPPGRPNQQRPAGTRQSSSLSRTRSTRSAA